MKLATPSRPTTKWSWTDTFSGLPASITRLVISMSAGEGVGYLPLLACNGLTLRYARPVRIPDAPVTIGDHVRARRRALGLTQVQAAAEIGLCRDALARWEIKDVNPDIRLMPRVIAFLGYDPQPPANSFKDFLVRSRRTLGLTSHEFSEQLGVPFNTLHGWERGSSQPTAKRRARVELAVRALPTP